MAATSVVAAPADSVVEPLDSGTSAAGVVSAGGGASSSAAVCSPRLLPGAIGWKSREPVSMGVPESGAPSLPGAMAKASGPAAAQTEGSKAGTCSEGLG